VLDYSQALPDFIDVDGTLGWLARRSGDRFNELQILDWYAELSMLVPGRFRSTSLPSELALVTI
jgi:hypothetical protein